MYAIVDIAGQQFKVVKDQQIFIHRLEGSEGDKVSFDQVLLIENDGKIEVGAPAIKDAAVTCEIIEHLRGDKVIVFKKKRRKGYQKSNGHRQDFTKVRIVSILETGGSKVSKVEKATAKVESKAKTVKSEAAADKKPAAKAKTTAEKTSKSSSSTSTAKKPAAKTKAASETKKAPAKKAAPKKKADDK